MNPVLIGDQVVSDQVVSAPGRNGTTAHHLHPPSTDRALTPVHLAHDAHHK